MFFFAFFDRIVMVMKVKKIIGIVSLVVVVLDQIIKMVVSSNMEVFKSIKVIPNFFYITYVRNEGAAFGILQNGRWFFIVLGLIAVISIIKYIIVDRKIYIDEAFSYGLVLGGIIGNLIDRLFLGYVVDYLDFYIFKYNFAVFNIADTSMVIGVIIIMYNLIIKGDRHEINISRK